MRVCLVVIVTDFFNCNVLNFLFLRYNRKKREEGEKKQRRRRGHSTDEHHPWGTARNKEHVDWLLMSRDAL